MSYLLSPDVTNPNATITIVNAADGTPIETRAGGLLFADVDTADGVSRLMTVDGRQVEQYPGAYASFSLVEGTGVYGRCVVTGALCAFQTRLEDQPFVYTIARLPA